MKVYDVSIGNKRFLLTQGAYHLARGHCEDLSIALTLNSSQEYLTAKELGEILEPSENHI